MPANVLAATIAYTEALDALSTAKKGQSDLLRQVILARDALADVMASSDKPFNAALLEQVVSSDAALRQWAKRHRKILSSTPIPSWRESALPAPGRWWWWLDAVSKWWRAATLGLWVVSAIALSFTLEAAKRLAGSATVIPSTVLQGFLGLLTTAAIVQFAKDHMAAEPKGVEERKKLFITRLPLAVTVLVVACAAQLSIPRVGRYFNNLALSERQMSLDERIQSATKAAALLPDNAKARHNLGSLLEKAYDYDRAEAEYRASRSLDQQYCLPDYRLASLMIRHRKDYRSAVELTSRCLDIVQAVPNSTSDADLFRKRLRYGLLVIEAWAENEEHLRSKATEHLLEAIELRDTAPAGHCLIARVLDQSGDFTRAKTEAEKCLKDLRPDSDEVQPDWITFATSRAYQTGRMKP
jgi:tetratricopeptide (TPR) repeat protein